MNSDVQDKWREIWSGRNASLDTEIEFKSLVLRLKEINGFDVTTDDAIDFDVWMAHVKNIAKKLGENVSSIYEVGCGCGANLVMLKKCGIAEVGGADYSQSLVSIATNVLGGGDITCCEAIDIPLLPKYDAVILDSTAHYFPSLQYARHAFESMVAKARYGIAVIDVHDASTRTAWQENRRKSIPNYEQRYAGLDDAKLFFPKDFFVRFAKDAGLRYEICDTYLPGYWNERYTYSVYLYKD